MSLSKHLPMYFTDEYKKKKILFKDYQPQKRLYFFSTEQVETNDSCLGILNYFQLILSVA